jgi:hypothetical protein
LAAGLLRLRNIKFLVLDGDFDEVLLGRQLMTKLGIDVTMHLNSVRHEFQDTDFSDGPSLSEGSTGILSRALRVALEHTPSHVPSSFAEENSRQDAQKSDDCIIP